MKCPVDGRELAITHREGIELDYCPECRGVWFDRGELDKVIERSNRDYDDYRREEREYREEKRYKEDKYRDDRSKSDHYEYKPKKKKASSFLSDLLEFG